MMEQRKIEIDLFTVPFPEETQGSCKAVTGYTTGTTAPEAYTVVVDATQPEAEQLASFLHECTHIWLNHFRQDARTAADIEAEAHRMTKQALISYMQGTIAKG